MSNYRNIIAILRGVQTHEVEAIVATLLEAGINKIEVPLNSPNPFDSIAAIVNKFKGQGIFGAGTVLEVAQVERLASIGAQLVVSPNCDAEVIAKTKELGMLSFPGVVTPTECFAALKAGADGLKFFPGEMVGPQGLKAMKAVLPKGTETVAVGGVNPDNMADWKTAGVDGFGLGSAVYMAGDSVAEVRAKADAIVAQYDEVMS